MTIFSFINIHFLTLNTMLGRQGWRLLTNQNLLVGRIFKAIYYPNACFAKAKLGSNPSYAWRSILAAQKILIKGSCIQVGNG